MDERSVDVVTVAQAMHWIEPESFFVEAERVARPGGAVVIWGYGDPILDNASLEATLHHYNRGTIERYWKPERQLLLDEYRDIPFPFREITTPRFEMEAHWNLAELAGYLRTWSATAAYAEAIGRDPIVQVEADLASNWGESKERHLVRWPLFVRAGFV